MGKKKRERRMCLIGRLLIWILCFSFPWDCPAAQGTEGQTPEELSQLYARSAVLMDGDSGRILFEKNGEEALPMASTTKIMTCILALELADEKELCQVSENAAVQPKVHLGMKRGETYYLGDLLYSLMLESHNDSAVCVAEHVGGSVEEFAGLMNQKAREIGCRQAHFVTPNGLDGEDAGGAHSITAGELARIMRYCIVVSEKKEKFLEITRAPQHSFTDASGKRSFSCVNHNALLTMMEGALCGKTGFTGKAGYCYVGAIRREEKTLIVALLACGWPNNKNYKWSDTRKLAEYGFSHYEKRTLNLAALEFPPVEVLEGVTEQVPIGLGKTTGENRQNAMAFPVEKDGTLTVLLAPEEKLQAQIQTARQVQAPVTAGETAGKLRCMLGREAVAEAPLVYLETVEKISYSFCLERVWEEYLSVLQ